MTRQEARARELHETRKANYARNWPWISPLTFDGGERDFCMETAARQLAEEDAEAAFEADIAAQLAAMTDAQLEANIAMCDFEVGGRYPREVIAGFREERRRYVKEQFRRSVAAGSDPLNAISGIVSAFVARSTSLDSLRAASGEPETNLQAAE